MENVCFAINNRYRGLSKPFKFKPTIIKFESLDALNNSAYLNCNA